VIPPKYVTIDVQATVVPYAGHIASAVKEAAEDMLAQWLNPASFGSETAGEEQGWTTDTKVRLYEAVDWLNRAAGVFFVETVQLRVHGSANWGTADIDLGGVAALPLPGDLNVTVNAG
jgi:hypothetical protein